MKPRNVSHSISSKASGAAIAKARFIGLDGALCGAGEKALGVSQYACEDGEQFAVDVAGISHIMLAATVAAGKPVASDADGKAVEAAALAAATTLTLDGEVDIDAVVPTGSEAVLSDVAQPTVNVAGDVDFTGSSASTAMSGGKLPVQINGWLLEGGDAGGIVAVKLV